MGGLLDVVLVLGTAEIGFAHAFVGRDFFGAAGGEDRALRHHGDVVGDFEHDLHVVLDDDDVDRCAPAPDFLHGALGLRRTHAAGRLVEQKQLRLGDQRHADLEQRHVAIGQRAGGAGGQRGEADLLESALDALGGVAVTRGRAERMQEAARLPAR